MNATAMADYECVYNMALLTTLKNQKLKIIGRTHIGLVGFNFRIKKMIFETKLSHMLQ